MKYRFAHWISEIQSASRNSCWMVHAHSTTKCDPLNAVYFMLDVKMEYDAMINSQCAGIVCAYIIFDGVVAGAHQHAKAMKVC